MCCVIYATKPLFANISQPNSVKKWSEKSDHFAIFANAKYLPFTVINQEKRIKNQPRTIDIDIVIFKDSFIDTSELQIPHPGALLRNFVLIPLAELIPNEFFPKTNVKIVDLLKKCPDTSVVQKYIINKKA